MSYYSKRDWAAYHARERASFSASCGGLDRDIKAIFFGLSSADLATIFSNYGSRYGSSAASYARRTYPSWKNGSVHMSGQVASRLLHLVPCILDASTQFSLAKKLRDKNRKKASSVVFCDQDNWEDRVKTEIARLIQTSREYQMPANYAHHIKWLANGDSKLAERLIILMDEEEAKIRLKHLESEFRNLRSLNCAGLRNANINHQIILPQGRVTVKIGNGLLFDFQRWVHGVFNK